MARIQQREEHDTVIQINHRIYPGTSTCGSTVVDVVVTRDPAKMLPGVDNRAAKIKKGDRVA